MFDSIEKIIKSFDVNEVEYVIIGGYAIILNGFLRATEDIDILLKMTPDNLKKFQKALREVYDDTEIDEINFEELSKYSVIRYGTRDNFYIDIISKIGKEFSYDNIEIMEKKVEDIVYRFASPKSLYQMKKLTYREKDKLDIVFLKNLMDR
ncbi:MAG TPA: hypothetical protein ENN33_02125 [Ignavibacteria bacterium]|nr:hypothetical protein [Ignavibacteria bacterium]